MSRIANGVFAFCLMAAGPVLGATIAQADEILAAVVEHQAPEGWGGAYIGGLVNYATGEGSWTNISGDPGDGTVDISSDGISFGLQGGYDWDAGGFLVGLSAGYLTSIDGDGVEDCRVARGLDPGNRDCSVGVRDIFTLGGRVGAPIVEGVLVFGSAGYANAEISTISYVRTEGPDGPATQKSDGRHGGYYLGAGAEYRLMENLSALLEYRYYAFSKGDDPLTGPGLDESRMDVQGDGATLSLGINLRF